MTKKYKDLAQTIERLVSYDPNLKELFIDLVERSNTSDLRKSTELHPFITEVFAKLEKIHGEVEPKEVKRAIIYFYSKKVIGIDVDLW